MGGLWDEGPVLNTSTTSTAQSWDRMPGSPNTQDLLKIQTRGGLQVHAEYLEDIHTALKGAI